MLYTHDRVRACDVTKPGPFSLSKVEAATDIPVRGVGIPVRGKLLHYSAV